MSSQLLIPLVLIQAFIYLSLALVSIRLTRVNGLSLAYFLGIQGYYTNRGTIVELDKRLVRLTEVLQTGVEAKNNGDLSIIAKSWTRRSCHYSS